MVKTKQGTHEKVRCFDLFFLVSVCLSSSFFSAAGSDTDERQQASSRQGPLPDLLPQNELPSWALPRHGGPLEEAEVELGFRRVATQLRAIGDELNATMLRRAVRHGTRVTLCSETKSVTKDDYR